MATKIREIIAASFLINPKNLIKILSISLII